MAAAVRLQRRERRRQAGCEVRLSRRVKVAKELKQKAKDAEAGRKRAEADRVQAQSEVEEAEAEQQRALADLEKNAKSVAAKKARGASLP